MKRKKEKKNTKHDRKNKPGKPKNSARGIISVHPRGFAFVSTENEDEKDIFIPPYGTATAMSDDRVLVRIKEKDARGQVGQVEKILERGHSEIIGALACDQAGKPVVQPLRHEIPENIPLTIKKKDSPDSQKVEEGDWIAAKLIYPRRRDQKLKAEFTRIIAKPGTIAADLDAIMATFDLPPTHSNSLNRRAAKIKPEPINREKIDPEAEIITVDPEDAKDFDDAISLHPELDNNHLLVGIHIADVAAFVQPGSEIDKEAAERGFTSYLPGRTLHMLPPALAAEKCSLRENSPHPAHSVFLRINKNTGEIVDKRRCHTEITVNKRLSFDDVQNILNNSAAPDPEISKKTVKTVRTLNKLAETMRKQRRRTESFLELETKEVRILCDEARARITGLKRSTTTAADKLVEEFMLAANVSVAEELRSRSIPACYRLHPEPDPGAVQELVNWAREIGVSKVGKLETRKKINLFLKRIKNRQDAEIIISMFLRTLSRAFYSPVPSEHYGLGKNIYCHFTSPIRRYPDLLIHQQLWKADQKSPGYSKKQCSEIANRCNNQEKNNDEAYFAALDRMKIRYIQELRMEGNSLVYEGLIARSRADGCLVFLPELGIFGELPAAQVPRRKTGKKWKSGDIIYVTVNHADPIRGQLILTPAG